MPPAVTEQKEALPSKNLKWTEQRSVHTDSSEDNKTVYRDAKTCVTTTYNNNPLTTGLYASGCCVLTEKQQTVK